MFNNRIKSILTYLIIGSLVAAPTFAIAENDTNSDNMPAQNGDRILEKQQDREQKREMILEKKEENIQKREEFKKNRCENVTERIKLKIQRYDENRENHVEKYQDLKARITTWLERAENEGYDTTTLEANLVTLDTKISDLADLHKTFMEELDNLNNYECGNSDGAFAAALVKSRESLQEIRTVILDIRKYYLENIKPEIKNIRNQMDQDKETVE